MGFYRIRFDKLREMKYFISLFFIFNLIGCNKADRPAQSQAVLIVNSLEVPKNEFAYLLAKKISHYDSFSSHDKKLFTKIKRQLVQELTESLLIQSWCKENNFFVSKKKLTKSINPFYKDYSGQRLLTATIESASINKAYWLNAIKREHYKNFLIKNLKEKLSFGDSSNRTYKKVGIKIYTAAEETLAKELLKLSHGPISFRKLERAYAPLLLNYSQQPTYVTSKTKGHFATALPMRSDKKSHLRESSSGFQFFRVISREDAALPFAFDQKELDKAYKEWLTESLSKASVSIDSQLIDSIIIKTRG